MTQFLDPSLLEKIRKEFSTTPNGMVVSWTTYSEILKLPLKEEPPALGTGLKILPSNHLKEDECFATSGQTTPEDLLGFINFCESVKFSWRMILDCIKGRGHGIEERKFKK